METWGKNNGQQAGEWWRCMIASTKPKVRRRLSRNLRINCSLTIYLTYSAFKNSQPQPHYLQSYQKKKTLNTAAGFLWMYLCCSMWEQVMSILLTSSAWGAEQQWHSQDLTGLWYFHSVVSSFWPVVNSGCRIASELINYKSCWWFLVVFPMFCTQQMVLRLFQITC